MSNTSTPESRARTLAKWGSGRSARAKAIGCCLLLRNQATLLQEELDDILAFSAFDDWYHNVSHTASYGNWPGGIAFHVTGTKANTYIAATMPRRGKLDLKGSVGTQDLIIVEFKDIVPFSQLYRYLSPSEQEKKFHNSRTYASY